MRRILFVDDEPRLLDETRRFLREQRQTWAVMLARDGASALMALDALPFDVVVADVGRAPTDGVSFLEQVRDRHPHVVRLILASYEDLGPTLRATPVAHQFLPRPCEPAALVDAITRSCQTRALLQDEALRRVVGQIGELPSQPHVYAELVRRLGDPGVTLVDLARLIERDVGMSAKCLQLVNSAFFGLPRRITSMAQAVSYLGINTLKTLVFSVELFQAFGVGGRLGAREIEHLEAHALLAARIAAGMMPEPNASDEAYMAAMLHDVGKLVLATRLAGVFREVRALARQRQTPHYVVERDILGVTHAEIGAYLLDLWGIPPGVVEAVAFHHTPTMLSRRTFGVAGAVYVANLLAHEQMGRLTGAAEPHAALDEAYLGEVGVADRLDDWRALAARIVMQASA